MGEEKYRRGRLRGVLFRKPLSGSLYLRTAEGQCDIGFRRSFLVTVESKVWILLGIVENLASLLLVPAYDPTKTRPFRVIEQFDQRKTSSFLVPDRARPISKFCNLS